MLKQREVGIRFTQPRQGIAVGKVAHERRQLPGLGERQPGSSPQRGIQCGGGWRAQRLQRFKSVGQLTQLYLCLHHGAVRRAAYFEAGSGHAFQLRDELDVFPCQRNRSTQKPVVIVGVFNAVEERQLLLFIALPRLLCGFSRRIGAQAPLAKPRQLLADAKSLPLRSDAGLDLFNVVAVVEAWVG